MQQSLTTVSQMLTRNEQYFDNRSLLICGAMEDGYPLQLSDCCQQLSIFTCDYHYYCQLRETPLAAQTQYSHSYQSETKHDALLLYLPKSKAEGRYLLANTLPSMQPGALIALAGENRGGIRSAPDLLAPYCSQVTKVDSARRCSLYIGVLDKEVPPFALAQWINEYSLEHQGEQFTIKALPGVFSSGHLDEGTELLLDHLPKLSGRVLDFGCGAGVIGSWIKRHNPQAEIEMVDINALALESSRLTLESNGLEGKVYPSDVFSDISPKFDYIVSNPPFHAGLKTHYAATEQFLARSAQYLSNEAKLIIVANAFLQYLPIMGQDFRKVKTVADNRKFRVYLAADH
ncbi:16S rRNA (guanine(1207)-N(2))-methyltransferase RsmC [Dongshaea marina]|uniref:16S rRNA (guanine(1207)-N(2))-methyltransferase RsmC n=1 Tax=Dongshaea marina TaxID=2047966 RepID=UPI000D3E5584|nr:16S rRNA (guanine(1207)-N(2))-methyltransferase RsmC [Dongshaea marina]